MMKFSRVLKEYKDVFNCPLAENFKRLVDSGCVHSSWKVANVTQIKKKKNETGQ